MKEVLVRISHTSMFQVLANEAGTFRSPEYVDAGPTAGEGNTVSYINDGEWLEYTVNIAQAGTYDLAFRYASGNTREEVARFILK
jgi:endo-1,3(4)-beta-glucanase